MSRNKTSHSVSVVIPTYNESRWIIQCVQSLLQQDLPLLEILIVDDGSTDDTAKKVETLQQNHTQKAIRLFRQNHKGPGEARNYAALSAKGNILLFVDADMTFKKDFVRKIIRPIINGSAIGTDSQSGKIANMEKFWSKCWNIGKFAAAGNFSKDYLTDLTPNKRDFGGVFRAILRKEFEQGSGFEQGGDYTDDTSLAKRMNKKAKMVNDAVFYHWNPDTVGEVWLRARWIGAGRNFTGTTGLKLINLMKFSLPASIIKGVIIGRRFKDSSFVFFKIVYDFAVWISVLKSI